MIFPFFASPRLACIDPLIARYDAFLVDQFGTLHDGQRAYPGATEALQRIRAAGRQVVILSNSGRDAASNARRLESMGIGAECYDLVLTSGELAARLTDQNKLPIIRGVSRCLLLERAGGESILARLGLEAAPAERAQLVIIAGRDGDRISLERYVELLAPLAARGVPALCLNPDRQMLTVQGNVFGAGQIAEAYAALGGDVTWIGKPYRAIYEAAFENLGGSPSTRVVGIGDSVEHDVAGALGVGCRAWLVRSGIIEGWDDAAIDAECHRCNVVPDGVLDAVT